MPGTDPDFVADAVVVLGATLLEQDGVDQGAVVLMRLLPMDGADERVLLRVALPGGLASALAEGLGQALTRRLDAA